MPLAANPVTAHLFIVNPLRPSAIASLFSTHPPTTERIRRLREIELRSLAWARRGWAEDRGSKGRAMPGRMTGGSPPDRAIATAVRQVLGSLAASRCAQFRLNVVNGWIILDGEVRDRAAWDELARAIAGVDGVEGVDDRAVGRVAKRVRRPSGHH
jgi:osmotically-inducible protein OsmY